MLQKIKLLAIFVVTSGLLYQSVQAQMHSSDTVHSDHSITIIAEDYAYQAPNQIPSGWTTIQFENHGNEDHFLLVAKVPDGKSLDDYASQIVIPFNEVWYALRDDGLEQELVFEKLMPNLPEWFAGIEFMGGTGIVPAGASTQVTLNLNPGTHILECYYKNEEGEMHSVEGMLRELTVTDSQSDAAAPEADINITLSNFEMDIVGDLKPGKHTFSVHLVENPEQGFGHNVHVVRVDDNTQAEEVLRWINFTEIDGLRTPSPYTFAGGMHLMPAGETAYFTTEMETGRYLFLSEYTGHLGVVKDVTVE
ncbi:hypothetical protein DYD21_11205 [Rhodohalobacter sp. SW132]|uniref:hypothetical protein n=1 Tax=Rhodohalobacter sp. SW132 TaxID=2293433 RepID=UPI000E27E306|nr:hypothetical protein [Rhodohalobacter sp. SW132]REL33340.1 hypothetical protein DYD21_11205 [Rhodohalobacter sp. SW132]